MIKYGEVEEIHVCDNIGDHIIGNVYIKYSTEEEAKRCMDDLSGKYYAGRIIYGEYCPVSDFREAKCRQYSDGSCERGGYCNFMHLKHVPKSFRKALFRYMYEACPEYKERRELKDKQEKLEKRERSYEEGNDAPGSFSKRRSSHSKDRKDPARGKETAEVNAAPRPQTSEERRAMIAQWNNESGS
jgi:splicing factor U2AF subunit